MSFVAFVQRSLGIGVWLLLSVIFPRAIRAFAVGIDGVRALDHEHVISLVFPLLREAVGATPTFGLFVLINIVSVILVGKFVPQTRGRRSWRS